MDKIIIFMFLFAIFSLVVGCITPFILRVDIERKIDKILEILDKEHNNE